MMSKSAQVVSMLAICLIGVGVANAQQSLDIIGLDGKKTTITFDGLPRRSFETADAAGIKTSHEGVALRDVLAKAGVAMGEALRGKALARVVIASAADGYQVAFALAELDPGFNDHVILVADTRNGKPLLADSGPLQIIVPQDKRAARWVRQVTTLEVRQLP
jgi:hypothetical protein